MVMSSTPTRNSAHISATLMKSANGRAHSNVSPPMLQAVIYSCTLKVVPIGSTPLTNDENRNTRPTTQRQTTFNV